MALELAPILEICLNLTILVGSLTSRQRKLTNDGLRTNKSAEADLRQVHKLELYGLGDKDVIDKLRSAEAKDNGNPAFKRSLSTLLRRPRERDPPPLPRYQPLPERPAEGHSQRVPKSVQPSSHAFRRSNSTPAVIGPPRYQATPDLVRSNSEPEPRVPESKLEVPPLQPESHSDDSELGLLYRPAIELHMPTPERASRPRYSTLYRQISDMPQQSNLNPTDPSGMIQNMLKEVRGMPPTPLQHGGVSRPVSQFIPLRPPRPPTVDFSAMADELPSSPLRPVALRDSRMLQTETNASRGSDSSSGFDTLLSHYRASRSLDDTRRRISSVVARTPAQSLPQFRVTSPINQSDDPVSHPLSENNITTEASEVLACPADGLVSTRPSDTAQQGHSEENKKVDTSSVDQSTDSPPLSSDPIFLDAMVSPEEATHDIQKHSSAQRVLPPSSMMHFESIGSAFSKEAAPKRQEVVDDLDQNDTGSAQKQVASSQSGQLLDLNAVNAKLERQSETQQNQRDDTDLLLTKLSLIEPSDMPGSQGSTLDAEGLAARLAIIAQVQRQSDDASSERKVGQSS